MPNPPLPIEDLKGFMRDEELAIWNSPQTTQEQRNELRSALEEEWYSIPDPTEAQLQQRMGDRDWKESEHNRAAVLAFHKRGCKRDHRKPKSEQPTEQAPSESPKQSDLDAPTPNQWLPVTPESAAWEIQQQKLKEASDREPEETVERGSVEESQSPQQTPTSVKEIRLSTLEDNMREPHELKQDLSDNLRGMGDSANASPQQEDKNVIC